MHKPVRTKPTGWQPVPRNPQSRISWLIVPVTSRSFNVFVFDYRDYRGHGASDGAPTPAGCFADSNAAIDYARSRPDVNPSRLLIFAQILGGNNAIAAVGAGNRAGVRALAEESAFFSYSSIAGEKLPARAC